MSSQTSHLGLPTTDITTSSPGHDPQLPPTPNPSSDPCLTEAQRPPAPSYDLNDDLFKLAPVEALRLLSQGVEALVRVTGDVPPTPPPTSPQMPNMRGMQAEKESIVRSLSERSLARLRQQAEAAAGGPPPPSSREPSTITQTLSTTSSSGTGSSQSVDGIHLREQAIHPFPTPPLSQAEPYIIIGENSQPLNLQHNAITRKFYSKHPPGISINDYLHRIHRFCPMSTAVYLATSLYIYRLAVHERAIAVTGRNAHRLLLAGLRVAMKALEDLSYPHAKIARVGGVTEAELARLEISFCFLTNFELVVRGDTLGSHWAALENGSSLSGLNNPNIPVLNLDRLGLRQRDRAAQV